MLWTARRVAALQAAAADARAKVRDLVERGHVAAGPKAHAWGQFLDEPHRQYGIFGTSACIQMLVALGYRTSHELIAGASRVLDDVLQNEQNPSRQKGDLCDVYKLAYLAEAIVTLMSNRTTRSSCLLIPFRAMKKWSTGQ